jgi:prepilin-type processing-associated H-X9-DG protein
MYPYVFPFMEQENITKAYTFSVAWNTTQNAAIIKTVVPTLVCPSAPGNRSSITYGGAAQTDYAPLSNIIYTAVTNGWLPQAAYPKNTPYYTDGVLTTDTSVLRVRTTDITDGLSYTLTVGEDAGRPQAWRVGGMVSGTGQDDGSWADPDNQFALHTYTADGASAYGPCPVGCTNDNELFSFHSGGAMVVFADGSVHFLSNRTSYALIATLVTLSAGEVVPADAF